MKEVPCSQVEQELWQYIDRELSAGDLAAISAHLRDCGRCRALYHEWSMEASQYRQAFLDSPFGERFVRKCMTRLGAEGVVGSPRKEEHAHLPRFPRIAALAALLLIVPAITAVVVLTVQPRPLGRFETKGLAVTVGSVDSAGKRSFAQGESWRGAFFAGSAFDVPAESKLQLRLDVPAIGKLSTLDVSGPATVVIDHEARRTDFRAWVSSGSVDAKVAKLDPRQSFVIDTPDASARVVGTAFGLQIRDDGTVLTVTEGSVRFEAAGGRGTVDPRDMSVRPESGAWIVRKGQAGPELLIEATGNADGGLNAGDGGKSAAVAAPGSAVAAPGSTAENAQGAQATEPGTPPVHPDLDTSVQPSTEQEPPSSREDLDTPRGKENEEAPSDEEEG